jgi:hypothetical protein
LTDCRVFDRCAWALRAVGIVMLALAVFPPCHPLAAQRVIDLTQRPLGVIHESFTSIAGVRALPNGRAVVTDQADQRLLLVNFADGSATPIGRQGEGPAEYRFPLAPLPGPLNTTYVVDASLQRMLLVSTAGAIVSTVSLSRAGLPVGANPHGSDRSGRVYFEQDSFDPDRGTFSDSVSILRWNPHDSRIDRIGRVWSGGRVIVNRPTGKASLARSITPYPALDAWAVYPNGDIAIVHHQPFRLDVVSATGVVRHGSPRSYPPLPVTAADRSAYRKQMSFVRSGASLKGGGTGPQRSEDVVPDAEFPLSMPPFVASSVAMSPDGQLWIGRSHPAGEHLWYYDIFDARGAVVAVAKIAAGSKVVGFGPGVVYVARTDPADDLVYLERYER